MKDVEAECHEQLGKLDKRNAELAKTIGRPKTQTILTVRHRMNYEGKTHFMSNHRNNLDTINANLRRLARRPSATPVATPVVITDGTHELRVKAANAAILALRAAKIAGKRTAK
jgi:hypothetical protein